MEIAFVVSNNKVIRGRTKKLLSKYDLKEESYDFIEIENNLHPNTIVLISDDNKIIASGESIKKYCHKKLSEYYEYFFCIELFFILFHIFFFQKYYILFAVNYLFIFGMIIFVVIKQIDYKFIFVDYEKYRHIMYKFGEDDENF